LNYKNESDSSLRGRTDWDIIELDYNVDVPKLIEWYTDCIDRFKHLRFDMSMKEYLTINARGIETPKTGNQYSYMISWPVDKDIPIPPSFLADSTIYPEINSSDYEKSFKVMDKFKYGYMRTLYDLMGDDLLKALRITIHEPGAVIDKHNDGANSIRFHIPIVTDDEAYFYYGDSSERKYNLVAGKMYIINTHITHSTVNEGNNTRAHLLSHPVNIDNLLHEF
jgi:quercetin dioxygenase-like cupin family protein